MESKKTKLIFLIVFICIILGSGMVMYRWKIKGARPVKTEGYRTRFNPTYLDSVIEVNTNQSKKK